MSELPALPLLFTQLQARYPTSGLLTELVQMDTDRCVVRALVQLGSMTLATSMATAATVEQAEDQARLRVLALLGIDSTLSDVSPRSSVYSTPAPPLTAFQDPTIATLADMALQDATLTAATLPNVEPIAPPLPFPTLSFEPTAITATPPPTAVEPYSPEPYVPEREPETFDASPDLDDASYNAATYEEEPFEEHEPLVEDVLEEEASSDRDSEAIAVPAAEEPAPKSKPRKSSADKPPVSETTTSDNASSGGASRDLSSLISQIGVEIDRIGWSKRQGSTYLQKTYGKKTRSELTDDELEDFLTYLNTQPSATVSS